MTFTRTFALPVRRSLRLTLPFGFTVSLTLPARLAFRTTPLIPFPASLSLPGPGTTTASVAVPLLRLSTGFANRK